MASSVDAVAGRLRRPSWRDPRLLAGLALIAVAVVLVVLVVQQADTTQPRVAASKDLAPGTVLSADDLVVVKVRVSDSEYVSRPDAVVGRVLERSVGEGELIAASALIDVDGYNSRAIAIDSALPIADGVGIGSLVDVWVTVQLDSGPRSTLVGSELPVTDIREGKSSLTGGEGETVYVAVPLADVSRVLDALASDGDVAVVAAAGG